jgi:hypothetical protein
MQLIMLFSLFPDVARRETRSITVPDRTPAGAVPPIPAGQYGFAECFCVDPKCDCRRVIVAVLSTRHKRQVATINHAFEKPAKGSVVKEQTFLDPLNPQSKWSDTLMRLFLTILGDDPAYAARIVRHYKMVKDAVKDLTHPIHARIAGTP